MFPSTPLSQVVSQPFKRAQLGLFHGKTKLSGNNVPFSKHKTRRTWLPNVQRKRLWSEALGEHVRVHVTTRALRSVKKSGGLDNYVKDTRCDLIGEEGMRIRLMVKEAETKKGPQPTAEEGQEQRSELQNWLLAKNTLTLKDARAFREKISKQLGAEKLLPEQTVRYIKTHLR